MQGERGVLRRWDEREKRVTREELFEQGRAKYEAQRAAAAAQAPRVQRMGVHKRVQELRQCSDPNVKEKKRLKRMAAVERSVCTLAAIQKRKREEAAKIQKVEDKDGRGYSPSTHCGIPSLVHQYADSGSLVEVK